MGIGFCFPWQNSLALEKGKISRCLNSPFLPAVKAWLLRENLGRGSVALATSWHVVPPRLLSALNLGCFSSVFPSHPPTAPSVLPPCPLPQGSCCPLAPTSEPSQALVPQGQQEEGGVPSPVPAGFFSPALCTFTGTRSIARGPWVAAPAHPRPPRPRAAAGCPHQGQEGAQALLGPSCGFSSAPSSPGWESLPAGFLAPRVFPLGSVGSPSKAERC